MKIVFLHGIGNGDPNMNWLFKGLNKGLEAAGHPTVNERDVIAPHYSAILDTKGISAKMPAVTYKPKDKGDRKGRREFERRQAAVQRFIRQGGAAAGFGFNIIRKPWLDVVVEVGVQRIAAMDLDYVKNYVENEGTRAAVLQNILRQLPARGEIILIGHSLGSVIAIDLLDHLPEHLRVHRFITIGSPANSPSLYRGREHLLKKFPYGRVDDWTNIFSHRDVVTSGRGLAAMFPGAQDFALNGADWLAHDAPTYMRDPVVVKLVAHVLYPSKEIVPSRYDLTIRLSDEHLAVLTQLRFAHNVARHIKDDDRRIRYTDALQLFRDELAVRVQRLAGASVPLPAELYEAMDGKIPSLPERFDLHDAVTILTSMTVTNFVDPYEIEAGDAPRKAVGDMLVAMGLPRKHQSQIVQALEEVDEVVNPSGGFPMGKIGVAAAGLALMAAGPIGIAMAAPAGAAGAAAIVGGLAGFGPGGMMGGLAALGGLAAGGAGIAAGAAFSGAGTEHIAHELAQIPVRVAATRAHQLLHLPEDPQLWGQLTLLETQIAAGLNRLAPYSDADSPRMKQLHTAQGVARRLLHFLAEKRLSRPAAIPGSPKVLPDK